MKNKIGVILMTYGSATTAEGVREYMNHIFRGVASDVVVKDFERRYELVGHSPLIEITTNQARLLQDFLNVEDNDQYMVRAGMLHSGPFIGEAIRECKEGGAERCFGIILSPQFSSFIMEGYRAAFGRAAQECGFSKEQFSVLGPWPTEPHFIELLAKRVRTSLEKMQEKNSANVPVIFTTHSLPRRVVDKDPLYLDQLKLTTDAVLERLKDISIISYNAYQSAGHSPEEWLKPDLTDILLELKQKKAEAVLIVPIQFLSDHLEILYDLDIAARKQCEDFGLAYHRIELPNSDTLFIQALGALVKWGIGRNMQP